MGKSDFLSPKAIANRIKSKGLQKLRWYCQMCQKQCRDEVSAGVLGVRGPSGGPDLRLRSPSLGSPGVGAPRPGSALVTAPISWNPGM